MVGVIPEVSQSRHRPRPQARPARRRPRPRLRPHGVDLRPHSRSRTPTSTSPSSAPSFAATSTTSTALQLAAAGRPSHRPRLRRVVAALQARRARPPRGEPQILRRPERVNVPSESTRGRPRPRHAPRRRATSSPTTPRPSNPPSPAASPSSATSATTARRRPIPTRPLGRNHY
jgi:hypothetical protein